MLRTLLRENYKSSNPVMVASFLGWRWPCTIESTSPFKTRTIQSITASFFSTSCAVLVMWAEVTVYIQRGRVPASTTSCVAETLGITIRGHAQLILDSLHISTSVATPCLKMIGNKSNRDSLAARSSGWPCQMMWLMIPCASMHDAINADR